MLSDVKKTIEGYGMFAACDRVLVAVSGGPDSMALLNALKSLEPVLGLEIFVASFDHGVRRNSSRDVRFVKTQARKLGLRFFEGSRRRGKPQAVSEEALRKIRYAFLLRTAKLAKADCLALGHTLDDQAETVLMRLIRGSGLWGLASILPVRVLGGIKVVRPLIGISRREVMAYLKKEKIAFRTDETNSQDIFLRNKIRGKLLPFLEKGFSPRIRNNLAHIALSVGADYAHLAVEASEFLKANSRLRKGRLFVQEKAFKDLDISLRRMALRMAVASLSSAGLSFAHSEEFEDLLWKKKAGSQLHLPDGCLALKERSGITFFRRAQGQGSKTHPG
ncbi:MAG: tRNA lysidine(34) synthetase TilS [Candidatus Omnitrophota bacterium]